MIFEEKKLVEIMPELRNENAGRSKHLLKLPYGIWQ